MILKKLLSGVDILEISDISLLDIDIKEISYNSNNLKEDSLFIAYKGANFDSHSIVDRLFNTGRVIAFVTEKAVEGFPFIRVDNGRIASAIIIKNYFSIFPGCFKSSAAVTGTNGKTTISYLMDSIYNLSGLRSVRLSTTNYKIVNKSLPADTTTPGPYVFYKLISEGIQESADILVAEVSSHALAQDRVYGFRFDLAIFTNLSGDHMDYHENMDDYYNAKKKLFSNSYSSIALINIDDEYGKRLYRDAEIAKYSYSLERDADIKVISNEFSIDGVKAKIQIFDKNNIEIMSHLVGKHNLYNIVAAAGGAFILGLDIDSIIKGIGTLRCVPGRLEKLDKDGICFFVDYAHTDDALENVLKTLVPFKKTNLITVFGCGGDRDITKRPRMGSIAEKYSDMVILTSDNPRTEDSESIILEILKGITDRDKVYIEADRREAIKLAYSLSSRGDIVLIAGKGHEDYQIIGKEKKHFDDREEIKELSKVN